MLCLAVEQTSGFLFLLDSCRMLLVRTIIITRHKQANHLIDYATWVVSRMFRNTKVVAAGLLWTICDQWRIFLQKCRFDLVIVFIGCTLRNLVVEDVFTLPIQLISCFVDYIRWSSLLLVLIISVYRSHRRAICPFRANLTWAPLIVIDAHCLS